MCVSGKKKKRSHVDTRLAGHENREQSCINKERRGGKKRSEHRVPIISDFISQPRQTAQTARLNHLTLA